MYATCNSTINKKHKKNYEKVFCILGIILFVQILYSCTSPIIPYSIDAKKEDPPLETLINWEGWYTIKAIKPFFAPWDYLEDETVFRCFFSSQYFSIFASSPTTL